MGFGDHFVARSCGVLPALLVALRFASLRNQIAVPFFPFVTEQTVPLQSWVFKNAPLPARYSITSCRPSRIAARNRSLALLVDSVDANFPCLDKEVYSLQLALVANTDKGVPSRKNLYFYFACLCRTRA